MFPWLITGKYPVALTLPAQPIDQFDRGWIERQFMGLALFDVCAWFDPVAGFLVELFPACLHRLARPATGQHDEADTVGSAAGILGQGVSDRGQLRLAEEPFSAFLVIACDAFAGIALSLIAPRQRLTGSRDQRQPEHL